MEVEPGNHSVEYRKNKTRLWQRGLMAARRKDGEEGIELTLKKSRKWTWRRIDTDVRIENLKIPISDNERRL
jgi:hypothetical protein